VFLSAEVQDIIRARLALGKGHSYTATQGKGKDRDMADDGTSSPPSAGGTAEAAPGSKKKRKIASTSEISWTICCLDGATFSVEVPERACVAEIRRAVGAAREVPHFAMELFIKDQENALVDELRMEAANRPPLFMLPKKSTERLALVALFKSTGGNGWGGKVGWEELEGDEAFGLEGLHGVDEIDAEGRVVQLALHDNRLAGPVPGIEVMQLSGLQVLSLAGNGLCGSIPPELGQLRALVELYLHTNQLSGAIPAELGKLGALVGLELNGNQLSGAIPTELGQLEALQHLYLNQNQLAHSIPAELGQLRSLVQLYLGGNQLTGSIPAELGKLGALKVLGLRYNQLSDSIPAELGQLGALQVLYLDGNQLSGAIPAEIGQLGALEELHLNNNQLEGTEALRRHMQEHNPGCGLGL
jgi:hypothetical protein